MDGMEELTAKQKRVIPYLLAAPSIEEGCRNARVNKTTVYAWLRDEPFREELRRQRAQVVREAVDTLKANVTKATETFVKLLDSDKEGIQARAAEDIIEFTQKAIEYEELERRVSELEARLAKELGRVH